MTNAEISFVSSSAQIMQQGGGNKKHSHYSHYALVYKLLVLFHPRPSCTILHRQVAE